MRLLISYAAFPTPVLVKEESVQRVQGALEVRQVLIDGGLQDRVRGVEVPVCKVVAHAGDLPPRDRRLRGKQIIRNCLDGLTDLQQTDADGIEYQTVWYLAARHVDAV